MNNFNYKTLVPSVVGVGILLYTSITGHIVSASLQSTIATDTVNVVGTVLAIYGVFKNHKKVG